MEPPENCSLGKGKTSTPWKINMEHTNHPFRKENDLPNPYDYVPCWSSRVYNLIFRFHVSFGGVFHSVFHWNFHCKLVKVFKSIRFIRYLLEAVLLIILIQNWIPWLVTNGFTLKPLRMEGASGLVFFRKLKQNIHSNNLTWLAGKSPSSIGNTSSKGSFSSQPCRFTRGY